MVKKLESVQRLLVVTPMHNEAANVVGIHETLSKQSWKSFDWVVVDDGSTDATYEVLTELETGVQPIVVGKRNDGGLIGGSAYSSWRFGVSRELVGDTSYSHVMKLDADVRLPADYFEKVVAVCQGQVGLAGGVLAGKGHREQALHVPGPVKLYSIGAYEHLSILPSAIGFDVMDEVALIEAEYEVMVLKDTPVSLSRAIGASEGGLHGRLRNGRVCRWTGYFLPYFLLHVARYIFRPPFVSGSIAMVWGYLRASDSPYPVYLREAHARQQKRKLKDATRSPVRWWNDVYNYGS